MRLYGENGAGVFSLPYPVNVTIDCNIGVPADSMKAEFRGGVIPSLQKIYFCDNEFKDGSVLFIGIVDEQKTKCSADGISVSVAARSPASLALDSECESGQYTAPSVNVMFTQHLEQFGIKNGSSDLSTDGILNISKGESHYGAVSRFCETLCKTVPRIDSLGVFFYDAYRDDEKILFDNVSGVHFFSFEYVKKRSELISSVIVNSGGNVCICSDDEAVRDGIVRERRLDLISGVTGTLSDADRMIDIGKQKSELIRLWCSGYPGDILGLKAEVNGAPFIYSDSEFYVTGVKYVLAGDEESTVVTLGVR